MWRGPHFRLYRLCNLSSAHHLGAFVIGTTSTIEKAEVAKRAGADHVVLYGNRTMDEVVKDIKALTPNQEGVHAVYDGVGKDTFLSDFEVVRRWVMHVFLPGAVTTRDKAALPSDMTSTFLTQTGREHSLSSGPPPVQYLRSSL
jgi:NADPH:quinone reductase-like Zn-dependent oxidoreductase